MSDENDFIKNSFTIRTCVKYCDNGSGSCQCGRLKRDHQIIEDNLSDWSYDNNTRLDECNVSGRIKFHGCDDLCTDHKFIRFNVIGSADNKNDLLPTIVKNVNTLLFTRWKVDTPKLIISVIGGFKRMDISSQQKKNFKQGLIEIMKKDKTVIVTGGFNVGVHKLVSETVREFRIYHENVENHTCLIGISTWGVVWSNKLLGSNESCYPSGTANERGKVALDPNCDCFLFCDDGTERKYDKEVDFRLKFEKYVEEQAKAFAVQILFEGGYRAIIRACETLESNISMVVLKGSGRAADVISEVMELNKLNLEKHVKTILEEYKGALTISDKDMPKLIDCLKIMYEKHHKQIVIYDMHNINMKFGNMIVEAIISGQTGRSLADTLDLTIRFNCADIAQKQVFSSVDYSKIDPGFINQSFVHVLRENKYEFVIFFVENDIEIEKVVTMKTLTTLYQESTNIFKCPYAELIRDLLASKNIDKYDLAAMGRIISILSGNVLENFYDNNTRRDDNPFGTQDLFLWSIISGRIELAEIFWRIGKDHISSGLIASTMFKNMAYYILKRGDSELQKQLSDASTKFENLAFTLLTKAYMENKKKTFMVLIRELKTWNNMTCFRIALSGNLLEFLSHSACRSYTTQVWMGGLSPFLSLWKILLTIPFSLFCIYHLIMPSFQQKTHVKKSKGSLMANPSFELPLMEECNFRPPDTTNEETTITFCRAMKIFYSAPIVKFYINFASYIAFLFVFAYLNLVELKPRNKINGIKDMGAEIFVYAYLVTFITEEIRQIKDQDRIGIIHKIQAYFSGSCNQLDLMIIFMFSVSTIVRFSLLEDKFMICRCMFSISYCMFCLRTMQFYFAYEFVGPKVIMIRNMIRDIVFFLSIFALFIVSFGTLSHSMRSPNSALDIFLIKDIFQMPYFQTYGELMLDKLFDESACNTTNCHFQQTTVTLGFALYLLLTNILLINLLIAMFGYTFNKIQEQSEKYWLFIRLQLVEEFYLKPILSPPLNLLYYVFYALSLLFKLCCRRGKEKVKHKEDEDLLLRILSGEENLKITGFEQICMESSMEEMQSQVSDGSIRIREENNENADLNATSQLSMENRNQQENPEYLLSKSFQLRCDKRLEKLEKSIELLISKEKV